MQIQRLTRVRLADASCFAQTLLADARALPVKSRSVDLVVTSPPYWRARDYTSQGQLGQEKTAKEYVDSLRAVLHELRRVVKPSGSVFLNVGDTIVKGGLVGIPGLIEAAARDDGWVLRNRIVWTKPTGLPSPHRHRLTSRHEYVLHLTGPERNYFYDWQAYVDYRGNGASAGDVWDIPPSRHYGEHPAPFPEELVARAVVLACPQAVCRRCGTPRMRLTEHSTELDLTRQQARRAVEIAKEAGLTKEHLAAVRAVGISDSGKGKRLQRGSGENRAHVLALADEAKRVLGGYFREFTFPKRTTVGFTRCSCKAGFQPGLVFDPFVGSGTTTVVAKRLGRRALGSDLRSYGAQTVTAGHYLPKRPVVLVPAAMHRSSASIPAGAGQTEVCRDIALRKAQPPERSAA